MSGITPGLVPQLRSHLLRMAEPGGFFAQIQSVDPSFAPSPGRARLHMSAASLWWVSTEMVDVLTAAAKSVPDDVRAEDIQPLDTAGLVVLESPWMGLSAIFDSDGRGLLPISAFTWGPAIGLDGVPAVSIACFCAMPPAEDLDPARRLSLNGVCWMPCGGSDWLLSDAIGEISHMDVEGDAHASVVEDRKILCALMTLLAHPGIAEQTEYSLPRGERRRCERSGLAHDVRVVTLRTLTHASVDGLRADETRIERDHRWIVSGHWRRQPFGPNAALRRLQWINPHVKGPEDAPLVLREVVHAWRR